MTTEVTRRTSITLPTLWPTGYFPLSATVMTVILLSALVLLVPPLLGTASAMHEGFYKFGMKDFERGDYEAALSNFTMSAEDTPGYASAWMGMGRAYNRMGQYDQAIEAFTKALQRDPDNSKAFQYRGYSHFRRGNLEASLGDLDQALELDPVNPGTLYARGIIHYRMSRFDLAIDDFGKALEFDANNADVRQWRGRSALRADRPAVALEDFTYLIKHYQANPLTYYGRGLAHMSREEFTEAIADFNESISRSRYRHAPSLNARGLAHYITGDLPLAGHDFTQAIDLDPKEAEYYYNRGRALYLQQQYDLAMRDFEQAVSLNPAHHLAYLMLWNTRMVTGTIKETDDLTTIKLSMGLDAHPHHNTVLLKVSETYLKRGNQREACRWAEEAKSVLASADSGEWHGLQLGYALRAACGGESVEQTEN